MRGAILRRAGSPVKDRGGGIRAIPLVTAKVGSRSMLNGITTLDPGAAVPLHTHNCEESVVVLSGQARAYIDGVETDLVARDATRIPAEVPHFFRNMSETEPMSILWTYASIDATRTIVATGVTTRIDEERGNE
jgi:uncharacterized RmlC-like cupin family protein